MSTWHQLANAQLMSVGQWAVDISCPLSSWHHLANEQLISVCHSAAQWYCRDWLLHCYWPAIAVFLCCRAAELGCCSSTELGCCSVLVLQFNDTAVICCCNPTDLQLQCYSAARMQSYDSAVLQCYGAALQWCCSAMMLQLHGSRVFKWYFSVIIH